MERILLGDNQFFGVNHMSEEKARAQAIRFQTVDAIIEVLDIAYDEGIRAFMCTTHEQIAAVCDHVRAHPERYRDLVFYPCMPYAHKYANAVTEQGLLNAVRTFLPAENPLASLLKGGLSLAQKDIDGIAELLVSAEMKMFRGLSTPIVFMQNVLTDMLLGLDIRHAFVLFADIVREKYSAEPGFITMNMVRLLDVLDELGFEDPIVCANVNKLGFRMCGGQAAYEEAIATRRFRPVAMSVFASGAVPAREAIQYVCDQPGIQSIVFGASSRGHISETKRLIEELTAGRV